MPGTVVRLKLLILDGLQVHDTKSPASYRPNWELLLFAQQLRSGLFRLKPFWPEGKFIILRLVQINLA